MSAYENASSLMATSHLLGSVSQLVEPFFLFFFLFLLPLLFSSQPDAGHTRGRAASLSGLSRPWAGNYEDDSVVHFVMLSLTYELWAIFQNFSQGGHSHLQGLGVCSRGARGWGDRLFCFKRATRQHPRSTSSCTRLSLPFWVRWSRRAYRWCFSSGASGWARCIVNLFWS